MTSTKELENLEDKKLRKTTEGGKTSHAHGLVESIL
jgi:hypothetical protein